ncbi:DUF4870 domain-containing protein [Halorubrum tebenquichense]|uniref:DUF4870 domain-containing protein n=1 Tax=Halorubrum tebenquichense DSM 14210 TaxID=1227485 RepID=M0E0T8_9EURY|nr:DUF4870 domain-containing protein [Halorubrum tebenquichense]ELZ40542.1 hypothetical protein C472_01734 [Halorubrum tebenquichense DSM 14210]
MAATSERFDADGAKGDTTLAAITHLLALFTWVVGPLVVYVVTDDAFVKENARNALNWQIWLSVYSFVALALVFLFVGFLILPILGLLDTVFVVVAAVKASEGEAWSYPLTIDVV